MLAKAAPRSTWMSPSPYWPTLCHHSFSAHVYLPAQPWLYELSKPEFAAWFWTQAEPDLNGCRLWRPDDLRVTLADGWSESAERIAWCLDRRHEPGDRLHLVRDCPNERCIEPRHLFFVEELVDFYSRARRNEDGCWIWQGSKTHDGYGRYFVDGVKFAPTSMPTSTTMVWSGRVSTSVTAVIRLPASILAISFARRTAATWPIWWPRDARPAAHAIPGAH